MLEDKYSESSAQQFSNEAINLQLQKIIQDPVFENSIILKNFLQYIVEESLQGNSNKLKEYTIAISVLHKPIDFNTQENGIVRIHAARLRRILDVYYSDHGAVDFIRISIPKGSYIPEFSRNTTSHSFNSKPSDKETLVIGIIPFNQLSCNESETFILKGLELQLSTALMKFDNFFIVDYQMISALFKKEKDIKKIINEYDLNYIMMGDANVVKKNLRLYVHLINASSGQQIWAQMYEKKIINNNYFEIQDEIVAEILLHMTELLN